MSDDLKQRIAAMRQVAEPFRDEPYTEGCSHCRMHMRRFNEEVTPANVLALLAELERLQELEALISKKAETHEALAAGSLPNDQTAARSACAARVLREIEKTTHRRDCGMPDCFICYGGRH